MQSKQRKHSPTNVLVLPQKHHYKITLCGTVLQQPHVAHIRVICFFVEQPVLTKPNTARKELVGTSDKHRLFPCHSLEIWRGKHWKGCGDAVATGLCTCPAVSAACVTRLSLTPAHLCLLDGWTETGCSAMCADRITLRAYIIHQMRHTLGKFLYLGSLPVHSTHIQRSKHRINTDINAPLSKDHEQIKASVRGVEQTIFFIMSTYSAALCCTQSSTWTRFSNKCGWIFLKLYSVYKRTLQATKSTHLTMRLCNKRSVHTRHK